MVESTSGEHRLSLLDFKLRKYNSSVFYHTGSVHNTDSCGKVTVIAQLDEYTLDAKGMHCYKKFVVQFLDGTYVIAWNSTLKNGKIRNPYQPQVNGVGFMGQGIWLGRVDGVLTKEYIAWSHMLRRCYSDIFQEIHPTYKGCTVDPRWFNFQLFCDDILDLVNYSTWKLPECNYQLDKDIKVTGNKVYSKETCMFVSPQENSTESNQRNNITGLTYIGTRLVDGYTGLTYIGTRLVDGYTEEFINISEFSRKYKLQASNIVHIINKTQKRYKCKGWTFSKVQKEE